MNPKSGISVGRFVSAGTAVAIRVKGTESTDSSLGRKDRPGRHCEKRAVERKRALKYSV
jgi:hypothetical protein